LFNTAVDDFSYNHPRRSREGWSFRNLSPASP